MFSLSKTKITLYEGMDLRQVKGEKTMRAALLTRLGSERLKAELDELWFVERPEVTKKVTWAASLGDRSENADYQYNKKRLREIDRRVRYLRKTLERCRVIDHAPEQNGRVFFGAWVTVENEVEEEKRFQVVGYDEIFGEKNKISIDSPMAKALLGKSVDDEVCVKTPTGDKLWWILNIEY